MLVLSRFFKLFQEQSKGQRPTPYEIFTRTHGVFDNDTGDCSQWTNSKSQKVNVIIIKLVYLFILVSINI